MTKMTKIINDNITKNKKSNKKVKNILKEEIIIKMMINNNINFGKKYLIDNKEFNIDFINEYNKFIINKN